MKTAEQACELERIRADINRLLESPMLSAMSRKALSARLDRVGELRAEWERIRDVEIEKLRRRVRALEPDEVPS